MLTLIANSVFCYDNVHARRKVGSSFVQESRRGSA